MIRSLRFWHALRAQDHQFCISDRVISIRTPDMPCTDIKGAGGVMYTAFHDVTEPIQIKPTDPDAPLVVLNPVTREQIEEIVAKVTQWDELKEWVDVTVHCDAGVSRSGAVAAYIFAYTLCPFPMWDLNIPSGPNAYMLQLFKEVTGLDVAGTLCEPPRRSLV